MENAPDNYLIPHSSKIDIYGLTIMTRSTSSGLEASYIDYLLNNLLIKGCNMSHFISSNTLKSKNIIICCIYFIML